MDLPEAPPKWLCTECDKTCSEPLTAPNPFDPEDQIHGCPHCKSAQSLVGACQVGDCDRQATMGTPGAHGFRYICTCSQHAPERPVR